MVDIQRHTTQIEILKAKTEADLEDIAQQEQGEREVFEWAYYKVVDEARSVIASAQAAIQVVTPTSDSEAWQSAQAEARIQGNIEIKLPTLKLSTFSDEYDQWILYKDISIINT